MAITGNQNVVTTTTLGTDKAYLHNRPEFTVTFTADQLITDWHLYQNATTSNTARVALYDVSGGTTGATLVAGTTEVFNGETGAVWIDHDLTGSEIPVPAGTYAICFQSNGWPAAHNGAFFENHNLGQAGVTDMPTPYAPNSTSLQGGAIALWMTTIDAVVDMSPSITSVNGGGTIFNGDVVTLLGANFLEVGNVVKISPDEDYNNPSAVTQTVISEGVATLDFTVNLPIGSSSDDPVFVFLSTGAEQTVGEVVNVTPLTSSEFTLLIYKASTTDPAVCMSSNFALGVRAYKNYLDPAKKEEASLVVAVDSLDTALPKYDVTFLGGPPIPTIDTVHFEYDQTVGDIKTVVGSVAFPTGVYPGTVC